MHEPNFGMHIPSGTSQTSGMSQGWGLVMVRVEQPGIGHTGVGRGVGEEGEGKGDGTLPTPHSMRAAPPTDLENLVCQSPRQSK